MTPPPSGLPEAALVADAAARARGRVAMMNSGRPDGLDGWTMDLVQYELVRGVILGELDGAGPDDVLLGDVIAVAQGRLGGHEAFPRGRLGNYTTFVKVDLEARGEVERLPGRGAQRLRRG